MYVVKKPNPSKIKTCELFLRTIPSDDRIEICQGHGFLDVSASSFQRWFAHHMDSSNSTKFVHDTVHLVDGLPTGLFLEPLIMNGTSNKTMGS